MAFTAGTIWETENGGDDTNNGGGFDTGVAGFPTDGAATLATSSAPVFTSASYNFVSPGDVGHWIYIKSGTNWTPGFYQIASVAANAATLTAGSGTAPQPGTNGTLPICNTLNTVAGCATTASPTGATWGIDYSQKTAAQFSSATFAIDATTNTKLTDGTNTIGKNWVGNIISITAGTGFTVQRVAVVSTSGTAATVDKSLGTLGSTSGTGRMGGAFASPGAMSALMAVSLMTAFIQNGTYSISSNTANVAGGAISPVGFSTIFTGYSTAGGRFIGNTGTQPVLQNTASTVTPAQGGNGIAFINLTFDGNSQTAARLASATAIYFIYCLVKNYNTATSVFGGQFFIGSTVTANSAAICNGGGAIFSEFYANTATPVSTNQGAVAFCLLYSNTGASTDGMSFASGNGDAQAICCVSYGNGRDGFRAGSGAERAMCVNCHAEGNTGLGYNANSSSQGVLLIGCSHFSNSGGAAATGAGQAAFVGGLLTLTASPFINAAGSNFALNNLTGTGQALRTAGYAGYVKNLFPRGLTTSLLDIGAAQSRVPWQTTNLQGGLIG